MNQEDTDWLVYHRIPQSQAITVDALARESGLSSSVIEESLRRLDRYCLVERQGSDVRLLTFGESLIRNQLKYEEDLPFVIENGVIREKKRS